MTPDRADVVELLDLVRQVRTAPVWELVELGDRLDRSARSVAAELLGLRMAQEANR